MKHELILLFIGYIRCVTISKQYFKLIEKYLYSKKLLT